MKRLVINTNQREENDIGGSIGGENGADHWREAMVRARRPMKMREARRAMKINQMIAVYRRHAFDSGGFERQTWRSSGNNDQRRETWAAFINACKHYHQGRRNITSTRHTSLVK